MKPNRDMNKDMVDITGEIVEETNSILNERCTERYFEQIVLLYSFIENLLKWLVYIKILWDKAEKGSIVRQLGKVRKFCKRLTFISALNMAYSINLIDFKLYEKLDSIREERNDIVHQLWIYTHRDNRLVLRKKLEKLARTTNELVGIFGKLTDEIGVDEVYDMFL